MQRKEMSDMEAIQDIIVVFLYCVVPVICGYALGWVFLKLDGGK